MANTLAGSYHLSAMVVMRNLRLPELDKNMNIEQQKPSYLSQNPANMM
jgi:hypothetical protein